MQSLINFTKKQYVHLGKSGEDPIIGTLQYLGQTKSWNLFTDHIELLNDEYAPVYIRAELLADFTEVVVCNQTLSHLWKNRHVENVPTTTAATKD